MDPREEFTNFVQRLKDQGFLDDQFDLILYIQKESGNPHYILELLAMVYDSTDRGIAELDKKLNEINPDYTNLKITLHRMIGSSSSIGGVKTELACRELVDAVDQMDRERCLATLERLKMEYINLHANLDILAYLQERVLASDSSGDKGDSSGERENGDSGYKGDREGNEDSGGNGDSSE